MQRFQQATIVACLSAVITADRHQKPQRLIFSILDTSIAIIHHHLCSKGIAIEERYKPTDLEVEEFMNRLKKNKKKTNKQFAIISEFATKVSLIQFPEIIITHITNWKESLAPYIWDWIHPSCVYADQALGTEGKKLLAVLFESLILCDTCKNNYSNNLKRIVNSFNEAPMQHVFISLHTSISMDDHHFVYDPKLVEPEYLKLKSIF